MIALIQTLLKKKKGLIKTKFLKKKMNQMKYKKAIKMMMKKMMKMMMMKKEMMMMMKKMMKRKVKSPNLNLL